MLQTQLILPCHLDVVIVVCVFLNFSTLFPFFLLPLLFFFCPSSLLHSKPPFSLPPQLPAKKPSPWAPPAVPTSVAPEAPAIPFPTPLLLLFPLQFPPLILSLLLTVYLLLLILSPPLLIILFLLVFLHLLLKAVLKWGEGREKEGW